MRKVKEIIEDSALSLRIDLLNWKRRWDVGYDYKDDCCQLLWCYASFGPIHLLISLGHLEEI